LWFTNYDGDSIGRITTSGDITNYNTSVTGLGPISITVGPDGRLWFTNISTNVEGEFGSIGSITTNGTPSSYVDSNLDDPGEIVSADGALWFTSVEDDSIGRVTTGGKFSTLPDASASLPYAITVGPDGALWFGDINGGSIGRLDPSLFGTLNPDAGKPGQALTITGTGFNSGEKVVASYETELSPPKPPLITICSGVTNSDGKFTCSGTIPSSGAGPKDANHPIEAVGQTSGIELDISFHTFR
jgi:hypothetical protein